MVPLAAFMTELPTLPKPLIVPVLVIAPPARVELKAVNWMTPLLIKGWVMFIAPLPTARSPRYC